jgi:hypothetical protein
MKKDKSETRNPKSETMSKKNKKRNSGKRHDGIFFEFRISEFGFLQ